MNLHENKTLFADAIQAASRSEEEGGLGIKSIFIEKDYWICRSLSLMGKNDTGNKMVFKGGTSLSKAYGIGFRFSEDIDIAVAESWTLNGNQLKNLIKKTSKRMTEGLQELVVPGGTSKGSHYHKAFYTYPRTIDSTNAGTIKAGQILIEINSFANPYPFSRRKIQSFLSEFLMKSGNENLVGEYDMAPFEINVLDCCRTFTEKLVSLFRCSLADEYMPQVSAKIRHFYDLHFLLKDKRICNYMKEDSFKEDFINFFKQDREQFDKPEGWKTRALAESPLVTEFHSLWQKLQPVYLRELPDLAYKQIPQPEEIERSIVEILRSGGFFP